MLNWIAWNRTGLTFNCFKQKLYLYLTELFEIQFGVKCPKKGWYAVKQNNQPWTHNVSIVIMIHGDSDASV